jgi:hypothetical protein
VSAAINLKLTLPDGDVGAYRTYTTPPELSSPEMRGSRDADARDWLAATLPDAIEQLYARAGLSQPADKMRALAMLLGDGAEHTPATLESVVATFGPLRDALHEVARELGVDVDAREKDVRTRLMVGAANLPRLAKQKAGDLARVRRHYDELKAALAKLAEVPSIARELGGTSEDPPRIVGAALDELAQRALLLDARGRLLDAVKEALGLTGEAADNLADEELPAAVTQALTRFEGGPDGHLAANLLALHRLPQGTGEGNANAAFLALAAARERELAAARRRGQLDVLEALDVDASGLPESADLVGWAQRARDTWHHEDTSTLSAELEIYRGYVAMMLADLGVGRPKRHEDVRSGAIHHDDLAVLVTGAKSETERLLADRAEVQRLRGEVVKLMGFFKLPAATPDEKLASRVIEAARTAIGEAADGARSSTRKVIEDEIVMLRAAFTASAQLHQSLTAVEGAAVRNGIGGETLKSMIERARVVELDHYGELAVLRHLAAEVSQMAGGSADEQRMVSSGELKAQPLANMLRDAKAKLRKDHAQAERDSSRRILTDIAAKLGHEELRPTLLPGAVGDLVRTSEAQQEVLDGVRRVLVELRDGLDCADEELPGLVRQTALTEGYPVGTIVELETGDQAMVVEISADPDTTLPIMVRMRDRAKLGVRVSEIKSIRHDLTTIFEQPRPGEFFTGDGTKAKAFHLPENGLADILKNAPWSVQSPARAKVEEAAGALADRIESFGDRIESFGEGLAERLGRWSDRVVAEMDEAIDKARKDGER